MTTSGPSSTSMRPISLGGMMAPFQSVEPAAFGDGSGKFLGAHGSVILSGRVVRW